MINCEVSDVLFSETPPGETRLICPFKDALYYVCEAPPPFCVLGGRLFRFKNLGLLLREAQPLIRFEAPPPIVSWGDTRMQARNILIR